MNRVYVIRCSCFSFLQAKKWSTQLTLKRQQYLPPQSCEKARALFKERCLILDFKMLPVYSGWIERGTKELV